MRRRMTVLSIFAAAIATTLFGVPLALVLGSYYHDDEFAELERLADRAAIQAAADLVAGRTVDELPSTESTTRLALYDQRGERVVGSGPDLGDVPVQAALGGSLSTSDSGSYLVVAVPVVGEEQVNGVIRAASPRSEVTARITQTWLVMAGLAFLAIAVASVLARWQAGRLAAPLVQLTRTADMLGGGDFTVRASRSGVPEIDSVASSLATTAERLGALLARERTFSVDASHQLRTPLTGLRLELETAAETADPPTLAALQTAIASVDRLEGTIDDLLSLARTSKSSSESFELDRVLSDVRDQWHGTLAAQNRPLRIDQAADLPLARASMAAVRQVLNVLLDNAAVHGAGAVTVTVRDASGALGIDVRDDGPGLRAPSGQLFEPGTADRSGHGIGLPLARSLIEAEGGRILFQGSPPTTFTVLLPATESAPGPEPPPRETTSDPARS